MGKDDIDYSFLDFYFKMGGQIIPVTKDKERRPVIKWTKVILDKQKLIKKYPITRYNYAFKIPDHLMVVDIEATKGGLDQLKILQKKRFKMLKSFHNYTGREGIHIFFKIKKTDKIKAGYSENYTGIEFLPPGHLVTIPPSIHFKTKKPYYVGKIKPLKKNVLSLPKGFLKLFHYKSDIFIPPEETEQSDFTKEIVLQNKIDELKKYLSYLDPQDFSTYTEWVKLLFSSYDLTKGDRRGMELFTNWSVKDERFKKDRGKVNRHWENVQKIKADKTNLRNLITWKTIVYIASKAGATIKINSGRLVDEILSNSFRFISTVENDGEYARFIGDRSDLFLNTPKEEINGDEWVRLTDGVLSRIMGYVFDLSGIVKNDFITMRVKDRMESNRVSLFRSAWEYIESKHESQATEIQDLKVTRDIYFKHMKHTDLDHAKSMFPYFVKYLVSGARVNLKEYDDVHRSNAQTCLCISSKQQGVGKSTFARALTPLPNMIYYPNLKHIREMEAKLAISRASMCIIDDYQPTYQKELNNLNEILTQHHILVRPKYGRIEISKTKRAHFALTTNHKKIHNDFTGTRRWINIDLESMNIEKILKLAPRMHGEMISLARSAFRHWFTLEEIRELEYLNEPFSGTETIDDILLNHYEENTGTTELKVSVIEIMRRINRAYGSGMVRDVRQLGSSVNRLFPNSKSSRTMIEGKKITFYNLRMINPFDDSTFIINEGGEVKA